ncbi:MAG: hypothetical protein G8237_01300 [Magnetococcales bacterium]|nr:hypothetical protein [Magnetococcales bacterium]NGZ04973.1 hypothetical protein [Magnetococcales bacterium]
MKNCWEKNQCGREPGGVKESKLGTCPVATFELADGFLGGRNGGRACIFIVGTMAPEERLNTCEALATRKKRDCMQCDFFRAMKKKYKKSFNLELFNRYIENSKTLTSG